MSNIVLLLLVLAVLAVVYVVTTGRKFTARGVLELVLIGAIVVVVVLIVLALV